VFWLAWLSLACGSDQIVHVCVVVCHQNIEMKWVPWLKWYQWKNVVVCYQTCAIRFFLAECHLKNNTTIYVGVACSVELHAQNLALDLGIGIIATLWVKDFLQSRVGCSSLRKGLQDVFSFILLLRDVATSLCILIMSMICLKPIPLNVKKMASRCVCTSFE
jgi:hypothetical protein